MTGTVFTERVNIDDIIRYEMYDGYCRASVTVHNRTGSTITLADVMGQPVRNDTSVTGDYMFCQATAESYCTGLCLHRGGFNVANLANLGTFKTKVLVRGPVIIDKTMLPATDVLGATFTIATIITALQGLVPPIVCNAENPLVVTQAT